MTLKNWIIVCLSVILLGAVGLVGIWFFPWREVNWGGITFWPQRTLTVVGMSEKKQQNKIAQFSAGVNAVNDSKDQAITEVNEKIGAIIQSVKEFGVNDEDIQTQNLSVYQGQDSYYDESGSQKSRPGQWRVDNTITIKLRDIDKASALAGILTKSGATNVYGPNFSVDTGDADNDQLLEEAIVNAQKKAEMMAKSAGAGLGQIVSVLEGTQGTNATSVYSDGLGAGGGGGGPVEPGSSTVRKYVTVTFRLE